MFFERLSKTCHVAMAKNSKDPVNESVFNAITFDVLLLKKLNDCGGSRESSRH